MTTDQKMEIRMYLQELVLDLKQRAGSKTLAVDTCADDNEYASNLSQHHLELALHRREARRLADAEAALERIESEDFGVCEECGERIATARLKANPMTCLCVHCQETLETTLPRCA